MTFHPSTLILALAGALLASPGLIGSAAAQAPATAPAPAAQPAFAQYPHRVDVAFVKQYAVLPRPAGVTIVDSRPAARKYDLGHIPTAVNIPDTQFDKLAPELLPKDKSQLVIFYCDGLECALSHNSAFKAEKLGYTQVRVYAAGFPDWVAHGNPPAVKVAQVPEIVPGKEAGTITVASFEQILKLAPGSVHLVDVRAPNEFAAGTFKGAVNLPLDTLEKNLDQLPAGKPIVFFCGAGARSGEAYDVVKVSRPDLKAVFLDAKVKWTAAGDYTIAGQ